MNNQSADPPLLTTSFTIWFTSHIYDNCLLVVSSRPVVNARSRSLHPSRSLLLALRRLLRAAQAVSLSNQTLLCRLVTTLVLLSGTTSVAQLPSNLPLSITLARRLIHLLTLSFLVVHQLINAPSPSSLGVRLEFSTLMIPARRDRKSVV